MLEANIGLSPPASDSTRASSSTGSFRSFFASARTLPVYVILGVQGSGTNLLRSILAGAFNFSVVQDQSLIYNAALKLGPRQTLEAVRRQYEFLRARALPSSLTRKTQRRIKTNGSFEGMDAHFDESQISSGVDLALFIYAYSAFSRGSRLMAIKSDDLWETIHHMDTVLPNRRVILLTRDFRDNLLSITNKDFGPREPLVAARYVKDRFSFYHAEFERTPPEHRFHVRYEDLLEQPEAFVTRLSSHFSLGTEGDSSPPVDTGRIRRDNKRKWARLSARQLAHCEAILRDELHTYGYVAESDPVKPPGAATWLMAKGRDVVRRIPQKLRSVARRLLK